MLSSRKLMRPRAWAEQHFAVGSIPSLNTLKSWIREGVVDGEAVNGQFYIYDNSPLPASSLKARKGSSLISESELNDFLSA